MFNLYIAIGFLLFIVFVLSITLKIVHNQFTEQERLKEQALNDLRHFKMYHMELLGTNHTYPFCSLIPIECLIEISGVLEHGAAKYSQDGWKTFVPKNNEDCDEWYLRKATGHIEKFLVTIENDEDSLEKESGCHHLAHAIANLIFVMWHNNKMRNKNDKK